MQDVQNSRNWARHIQLRIWKDETGMEMLKVVDSSLDQELLKWGPWIEFKGSLTSGGKKVTSLISPTSNCNLAFTSIRNIDKPQQC